MTREQMIEWCKKEAADYRHDIGVIEHDDAKADVLVSLREYAENFEAIAATLAASQDRVTAHDMTTLHRLLIFFETAPKAAPPFRGNLTADAALVTLRTVIKALGGSDV